MLKNSYRGVFNVLAISVFVVTSGCSDTGPRYYPVTGTVKFSDDSPAMFGTVECRTATGEAVISRGQISRDGSFRLRSTGGKNGLVAGKHLMVIVQVLGTPRPTSGKRIVHKHGKETSNKYRSYSSTDLVIEVVPDSKNHFDLIVDDNKKQ